LNDQNDDDDDNDDAGRALAVMVKNKNVYRVLVGKPEGMIPLGRLA